MKEEPTIQDVLEAVQSLATHVDQRLLDVRAEMKVEFADVRTNMATKQDLAELKNEIVTEIDRFVVLHQNLDVELVALRSRYDRLESKIS